MKYVLDHQSAFENGHDIMVIDSSISEYIGSKEQLEAVNIINHKEHKTNCSILKGLVSGCSNSLIIKVGKTTGNSYISSLFLTKDDKGRRIPFSFWSKKGETPTDIKKAMETAANIANMQLNPKDSEAVEKTLRLFPKIKLGIIGGIALLAIILLFIIL